MQDKPVTTKDIFTDPMSVKVLWAAMQAMVNDIHAPQDNMTHVEWERAEEITRQLDEVINAQN